MRKVFRRFAKIYLPRYWMQNIKKTVIKPLAGAHKTFSTCCDSKITIKIRVAHQFRFFSDDWKWKRTFMYVYL